MAYNYLDKTGLALVWEKVKNQLAGKVDTETGKGLSTNDYTSNEKTKLSGIATGAQVNVLEGIQKNGTTVSITNKIANITVPTATSDLTNDSGFITEADVPEGASASTSTPLMDGTAAVGTSTAFARGDHRHPTDTSRASASDLSTLEGRVSTLETTVTTVMNYKGTKATVSALPSSGNKNGDVWHVTENDGEYAWNGTEWEELGSTVDLSGYVQTSDMVAITSSEINTICT